MFVARVLRWYVFRPRISLALSRDLVAQFIRTDVLLACVRECVKNVHATHTPLQTPPTQTVGSPDLLRVRVCVYPLYVRPLHFTSTQSINPEIVFTLHIIGGHLGGVLQAVFPAVHSGMPVPYIRAVDTLFDSSQRGTHSHRYSHTLVGISNPTTSFQGSTASQLFLATTTLRVLSLLLSPCAFPLCFYASDTGSLDENR